VKPRFIYLIAAITIVLDQAAKLAVVKQLPLGTSKPIIHGVLALTSVHNPGGAFGTFQTSTGILTLITLVVVSAIVLMVRRHANLTKLIGTALALLLGGAVGNLIDRVRLHYVVDFIDLHIWPVFNVSDIAITSAMILLAWQVFVVERNMNKNEQN